jgi:hypothetical protein
MTTTLSLISTAPTAGLDEEGVFRVPGWQRQVKEFKTQYDKGTCFDVDATPCHVIGCWWLQRSTTTTTSHNNNNNEQLF